MGKIQKTSNEVKAAIQRKSAYSLPNNPTDSGYKANDIRNAFYKPIIDAANSALTEIDRIVDELNGVLGYSTKGVDSVESVTGIYYHGSDKLIYTFADSKFTISGYEGTEAVDLVLPASVFYDGAYYPVVAIAAEAFKNKAITGIEIPSSILTIGNSAFYGCSGMTKATIYGSVSLGTDVFTTGLIDFEVPKENLASYQTSLASYAHSITGFNTILNNANEIVTLKSNKLDKVSSSNANERVYAIGTTGSQKTHKLVSTPTENEIPIYLTGGRIKVGTPTENDDSTPKSYVEGRLASMGAYIDFSINPSTYVMTLNLKNEAGTVLSSGTVDLPLESMILGATYSNGVLTLNIKTADNSLNNTTIDVNISDLISGLVSESDFNEEVDRLDDRIDDTNDDLDTLAAEVDQKEIYAHTAFHSEESETAKNYTKGGGTDKKFRQIEKDTATTIALSMDTDYKLTVSLLNKKGTAISSGVVDLPIESLITQATYSSGVLTLTFQSGDTADIDISSLISGLVADTTTINGKRLNANITLSASDVNAYDKTETYTKTEVSNLLQAIQLQIDNITVDCVGYAVMSEEADKARDYIKGGRIDKQFKAIIERIITLENRE